MKQSVFILVFSFLGATAFCQTGEQGCATFKAGEFAYRDSANNIINVVRKGRRQKENDN